MASRAGWALLLLTMVLALAGCGDKCTASNCNGCCDASGTCQDPSPGHCGLQGASCSTCLAIQICSLGVCQFGGGNGGNGGTTGTHGAAASTTASSASGGTTGASSGTSGQSTGTSGSTSGGTMSTSTGSTGSTQSCAGDDCSAGQAYGGCCGAAPYCGGRDSNTQQARCQSTCNPSGKSCTHSSDCCSGLSCSDGLCAAPTCAGDGCVVGQSADGCCAAAPYCVGEHSGTTMACTASCGQFGARCGADHDCCSDYACKNGYCQVPTCESGACTYPYASGGCCAAAPNCVNYACTSSCGQVHDYCYADSDCCNGVCVTDGTDAYTHCTAICSGNSCSYGFSQGGCCPSAQYCVSHSCSPGCGSTGQGCGTDSDCCFPNTCVSGVCTNTQCSGQTCSAHGDCCSNAPYCTSYFSQPQRCASSCGQASMRCSSNSDCCGFNCALNTSDGLMHCR